MVLEKISGNLNIDNPKNKASNLHMVHTYQPFLITLLSFLVSLCISDLLSILMFFSILFFFSAFFPHYYLLVFIIVLVLSYQHGGDYPEYIAVPELYF